MTKTNSPGANLANLCANLCQALSKTPFETGAILDRDSNGVVKITPRANTSDARRIVGKGGVRFKAVTTLLETAAGNLGVSLEMARVQSFDSPNQIETTRFEKPNYPGAWGRDDMIELLDEVCSMVFTFGYDIDWEERDVCEVKVTCDAGEKQWNVEAVGGALHSVFSAIGTNKGCYVSVTTERRQV